MALSFFAAILQELEHYQDILKGGAEKISDSDATNETGAAVGSGQWRKLYLQKVQSALISSLEIGDEKVQIVQTMQVTESIHRR